ncbi:NUDIX hydrolase [Patescibacteria group bacterium]|nr:NUDIX hydrolase [Patescibacteria group bacterium]
MDKIKLGKAKTIYTGKIFTIKERDVKFSDGSTGVYEFCDRPDSVSVLAFNNKNELLMIKERRVGYNHNVWFLPGGRIDQAGDTPQKAIVREMREEAGYRPGTLKLIHKKSPSSTLLWNIYIFVAKDLVHDPLPLEKGEYTEPYFVPMKKALQMALDGSIENEFISYNIIRFDYMQKNGQFKW